jgi:16S rRNA (uracil1498-N3)-methyltransferase
MAETSLPEQYKRSPRLYVEADIAAHATIPLPGDQAHYLRNVMRLAPGERVRIFNGRDGEWLAALMTGKKTAVLEPLQNILPQALSPDVWALASPLRKESFEFMIEKATELGVCRILPVLCDHTSVRRLNEERAHAIAVEASEQSERLDVPEIAPLKELKSYLSEWDSHRKLIACLERESAEPILAALEKLGDVPLAVLVGPEGGFSPDEVKYMKTLPFVIPVSLGSRILRAETAMLFALSCLRAASCCCTE